MNIHAGATEGGVGEVTMVDGGFAARGNVQAVQTLTSKLRRRGIKLEDGICA